MNLSRPPARLISSLLAAAIGTLMCGILFALFPSESRMKRMANQQGADALSIAYLRLLLRAHPEDQATRLTLVRNLAAAGNWADARHQLAPLLRQSGAKGLEARLALIRIDSAMLQQHPAADPGRERIATGLASQLEQAAALPLSRAAQAEVAALSQNLNRPGLMARVLQQMADADPAMQPHWLDLAAHDFLSHSAPLKAANAYREIAARSQNPEPVRRKYALLALDTFLAANDGATAIQFAELMSAQFGADREFLQRVVAIAQGQNDMLLAKRFGRSLLALSPDDPALIARQVDIELAANDLPAALSLSMRLVALAPDVAHQIRLAQIAEWNDAQELALKQWTGLALRAPSSPAMARALLLAHGREDDSLWLELIGKATRLRPLTADEQTALLAIGQRKKSSHLFDAYLQSYLLHNQASPALWFALAESQAEVGDVGAALATLQRLPRELAGPVESARLQARLLARAARFEEAFDRLRPVRTLARDNDTNYWTLFGDTAWELGRRAEAIPAYRVAWSGDGAPVQVAERLIDSYNTGSQHEHAVIVAREAYRRFDEARWLILAIDSAARGERWNEMRELLNAAARKQTQFEQLEMYWLLSAHLANHDGDKAVARAAYHRALALNPASVSTRVALLWFEVDSGERAPLSELLQQWQTDAIGNAAYWGPFATGMVRLQRADEALPWFQRQVQLRPNELAWSLAYADALTQAGRPEQAWRVRLEVYLRMRPQFRAAEQQGNFPPKLDRLSYARLVREFEGNAAAQQVLLSMMKGGDDSASARELLVDSLLSQSKFDAARALLVRARVENVALPAWQYLAVAEDGNDRNGIEEILAAPASNLSAVDRIGALRKLGHNAQALKVAESAAQQPENAADRALQEAIEQLRVEQSKRAGALAEQRQLGHLEIQQADLHASVPAGFGRLSAHLAESRLSATTPDLALRGIIKETDFSTTADLALDEGAARVTVGGNRRHDDSLLYGRYEWSRSLGKRVGMRMDLSFNGVSEESAALRVIGKKDKLATGLTVNLSHSEYARLEVAAQRYSTRAGERLGSGYRVEGELGQTIFNKDPFLQIRFSGSWERNRLASQLPADLVGGILPTLATVSDVVAPRFGWVGVGATLSFGERKSVPGHVFGQIDALRGRQWPDRQSAYNLRFIIGVPLAAHDELRLEAFHSNVHGGVAAPPSRGLRLFYQRQF
jgi:predicted Zn-dependent protease